MKSDLLRFPGGKVRDPKIDAWLTRRSDELHATARHWFERMRACGSDVRELMQTPRRLAERVGVLLAAREH